MFNVGPWLAGVLANYQAEGGLERTQHMVWSPCHRQLITESNHSPLWKHLRRRCSWSWQIKPRAPSRPLRRPSAWEAAEVASRRVRAPRAAGVTAGGCQVHKDVSTETIKMTNDWTLSGLNRQIWEKNKTSREEKLMIWNFKNTMNNAIAWIFASSPNSYAEM